MTILKLDNRLREAEARLCHALTSASLSAYNDDVPRDHIVYALLSAAVQCAKGHNKEAILRLIKTINGLNCDDAKTAA
jgi:hypothetical protein